MALRIAYLGGIRVHFDVQQVMRHGPDPQVHFLDVLFHLVWGPGGPYLGFRGSELKGLEVKGVRVGWQYTAGSVLGVSTGNTQRKDGRTWETF